MIGINTLPSHVLTTCQSRAEGEHRFWWGLNGALQASGTRNLQDPESCFSQSHFQAGTGQRKVTSSGKAVTASLLEHIPSNAANKEGNVPSFLFVITLFCHCCQDVPMQYVPLWCLVPVCFIFSRVGCAVISHSFSLSILCVLFLFLHLEDFGKPAALLATPSLLHHLNLLCQFSSPRLGDDSLYICKHKWICKYAPNMDYAIKLSWVWWNSSGLFPLKVQQPYCKQFTAN